MKTQPTHTPTPWIEKFDLLLDSKNEIPICLEKGNLDGAVVNDEISKANRAFIVRAVNCHAELLEALKHERKTNVRNGSPRAERLDKIIAKAEGK